MHPQQCLQISFENIICKSSGNIYLLLKNKKYPTPTENCRTAGQTGNETAIFIKAAFKIEVERKRNFIKSEF